MPLIPAPQSPKQVNLKFQGNQGYKEKPYVCGGGGGIDYQDSLMCSAPINLMILFRKHKNEASE